MKPDTGSESPFLPTPPSFDGPVRGIPSEYCHVFGTEKLEWRGYPMVKNVETMFTRFDRIHEGDRRTHRQIRQIPHKSIGRAAKVTTVNDYAFVYIFSRLLLRSRPNVYSVS